MNNKQFKEQLELAKKRGLTLDPRVERRAVNGLSGMYAREFIPKNTVIASYPTDKQIQLRSDVTYPEEAGFTFKYIHAAATELAKGSASDHLDVLLSLETMAELKKHSSYFFSDENLQLIQQMNPVLARNINETNHKIKIRVDALAKFDPKLDSNIVLRVALNLISRAFDGFGFASVIDAFNHSDRYGNLVRGLTEQGDVIGIDAKKDYAPGEQIFNSYDRKDMYVHAISYNYFDPDGTHFIDYGTRITQTARSPLDKQILQHTAKYFKLTAKEFSGIIQYSAKDQNLFFLEHAPSVNLIDYIRQNCFQTESELKSGKCTDLSFDTRILETIDTLLSYNKVDDFQLSDIPKKLHRFFFLLQKEKQMLQSNREWAQDNRNSLR